MAYGDYLHCTDCSGKALYDDSGTPCAHCEPDEPGAIEVYCSTCTARRRAVQTAKSLTLCECQHPMISHNDNGGRNKKAYCTVWVHQDNDPKKPMKQCPCTDAKEHQ